VSEPRLVRVLRPIVGQHRKGKMALQQLRRPALPLDQKMVERVRLARARQAQEKLSRGRRRTGAGVEHGNAQLAPGESLVQDRQVADDDGDKAKAGACLGDGQESAKGMDGPDLAGAEREKSI